MCKANECSTNYGSRIYTSYEKAIESLVNGKVLLIEGGEYRLCDGLEMDAGVDAVDIGKADKIQDGNRRD